MKPLDVSSTVRFVVPQLGFSLRGPYFFLQRNWWPLVESSPDLRFLGQASSGVLSIDLPYGNVLSIDLPYGRHPQASSGILGFLSPDLGFLN